MSATVTVKVVLQCERCGEQWFTARFDWPEGHYHRDSRSSLVAQAIARAKDRQDWSLIGPGAAICMSCTAKEEGA